MIKFASSLDGVINATRNYGLLDYDSLGSDDDLKLYAGELLKELNSLARSNKIPKEQLAKLESFLHENKGPTPRYPLLNNIFKTLISASLGGVAGGALGIGLDKLVLENYNKPSLVPFWSTVAGGALGALLRNAIVPRKPEEVSLLKQLKKYRSGNLGPEDADAFKESIKDYLSKKNRLFDSSDLLLALPLIAAALGARFFLRRRLAENIRLPEF